MKTKTEILQALARSEDDRLLLSRLMEKERACVERGYLTSSHFLDLHEGGLCRQAVQLMGAQEHTVFYGGFSEAERVLALFFPDYITAQQAQEQAPIALLRAKKHPGDELTHRDYLGALMGLQIKREMIGDILLQEDGADLFVLDDGGIVPFLLQNYHKAGRKALELEQLPLAQCRPPKVEEKEGSGSVASPRLDSVVALIFGLSRTQAQEQIGRGLVFLNALPCQKNEREVEPGDRITVRGMGRARMVDFGGISKKGRRFIRYVKNV